MTPDADLVLASASPRRRELLERMGLRLIVAPTDVDETPLLGERPGDYVKRVAGAKCDAAWVARGGRIAAGPAVAGPAVLSRAELVEMVREEMLEISPLAVLAADTTVVVDRRILGKPADAGEAREMLALVSGRRHEVTTAYRIRCGDRMVERAVTTVVAFRALQPSEADAYVASGEWEGKAGGYAVQGIAGAFVTELRGSHTNVIGLPLAEVLADLLALGALPAYPAPGFGSAG